MLKKIVLKFRMAAALISKGPDYSDFFTRNLYRIYLGHNKIIHFRDGFPVYSLSTPALFSRAAANFLQRNFFKTITGRTNHNLMSLAITEKCCANCQHCSFQTEDLKQKQNPLKKEELIKLIKDAQELGVTVINILGGEPLLHPDILEIIGAVNKNLSTVILITNGMKLKAIAHNLKRVGLDGVYVSIDSADPDKHNRFRNTLGIFEAAMEGIKNAKRAGLSVGISCCVDPESLASGELEKIFELGKKIGVHEILVFGATPSGKYSSRSDLMDRNSFTDDLIAFAGKYNRRQDYPGILIYGYTSSHRSIGCSGGVNYFYVNPFGEVSPCDFNHAVFGNIREKPLHEILDSMAAAFEGHTKYGGCRLKDSRCINSPYVSKNNFKKI